MQKLTRELYSNATILDCAKNTSLSTLQNSLKAHSGGTEEAVIDRLLLKTHVALYTAINTYQTNRNYSILYREKLTVA